MTAKAGIQIQLKSPGCKLLYSERDMYIMNFEICIGNSMICSDIWHKYHEWYLELLYVISRAVRRVKFETILKYHEWYLCQVSLQIMLLFGYATTRKDFVIFTCRYFKLSCNTTALSQSNWRNFSCSSIMYVPNSAWCREGSGIGGRVRKKHQSYQLLWNWKKGWTFAYSLHLVAYDETCFSPLIVISTPFSNQWLWPKRTAKPTRRTLWTFFFCIAFLWMLQISESDSHLNTIVKKNYTSVR